MHWIKVYVAMHWHLNMVFGRNNVCFSCSFLLLRWYRVQSTPDWYCAGHYWSSRFTFCIFPLPSRKLSFHFDAVTVCFNSLIVNYAVGEVLWINQFIPDWRHFAHVLCHPVSQSPFSCDHRTVRVST